MTPNRNHPSPMRHAATISIAAEALVARAIVAMFRGGLHTNEIAAVLQRREGEVARLLAARTASDAIQLRPPGEAGR